MSAALYAAIASRRRIRASPDPGGPPVDPPPPSAPTASLSTALDRAAGIITSTPTFAAAEGETITSATLTLETQQGAVLQGPIAAVNGQAHPWDPEPEGTYTVRLVVEWSGGDPVEVTATVVLSSGTPEGRVDFAAYFPDDPDLAEKVEMIVGPQVVAESSASSWAAYDAMLKEWGLHWGDAYLDIDIPGRELTGTFSLPTGGATITGEDSLLLSETTERPNGTRTVMLWRADTGAMVQFEVSVESDGVATLVSPASWSGPPLVDAVGWTVFGPTGQFTDSIYYDLPLVLYTAYFRTGDPAFLTLARAVADAWWDSIYCMRGRNRGGNDYQPAPRNVSLGGMLLRALELGDSSPIWAWAKAYIDQQYQAWPYKNLHADFLYSARDEGYMVTYAAHATAVFPDSFPDPLMGTVVDGAAWKAALRAKQIELAVGPGANVEQSRYRKLQLRSGEGVPPRLRASVDRKLWYWFDGERRQFGQYNEPWHTGLLVHGHIDTHRDLVREGGYSAERAELAQMILDATEGLYRIAYLPSKDRPVYSAPGDYSTSPTPKAGAPMWRNLAYGLHNDVTPGPQGHLNGTAAATMGSTALTGTGSAWLEEADFEDLPLMPYRVIRGGLSLTNGSAVVTAPAGATTHYDEDVIPGGTVAIQRNNSNGYTEPFEVLSVEGPGQFTLAQPYGQPSAPNTRGWTQLPCRLPGRVIATNGSDQVAAQGFSFLDHYEEGDSIWLREARIFGSTRRPIWHRYTLNAIASDGSAATLHSTFGGIGAAVELLHSDTHGGYFLSRGAASDTSLTLHRPWPYASESGLILDRHLQDSWVDDGGSSYIAGSRQVTALVLHAFGYCYHLTGDPKWLEWGDEMFAATFGHGQGPGADAWGAVEMTVNNRAFNQSFRTSGRYLGWRATSLVGGGD